MLAATYVLSKLMLCFVSVECSDVVADHWFSILVSGNSGGYMAAHLANVQLST
jgi:hypothetical protein